MTNSERGDRSGVARVELHLPLRTIVRTLASVLFVYLVFELMPLILMLAFSVMLAVTLYPLFQWLRRHSIPRWVGVALVVGGMAALVAVVGASILPSLLEQADLLTRNLSELRQAALARLPPDGALRSALDRALASHETAGDLRWAKPLVSVGAAAFGGVGGILLILVFTIYMLTDGPRAVAWLLAFFEPETRAKLRRTADELAVVVSSYVGGQLITSVICAVTAFVILVVLHVPAPLMLATIAGILDVLPVLGFLLAAIPAGLLAFTVSPLTAALVVALYALYHVIENYVLAPKLYGSRLRLSDLAVLLSLFVAGRLAGVAGAIAALPLVASYPIIERIWLVDVLGAGVIRKHSVTAKGAETPDGPPPS